MSAQLPPPSVTRFFDNNGAPLFLGKLFTYVAGTTTPQATYIDSTQTTPNTNPVIMNFRGECQLWLDPTKAYKFLLQDALGNTIPGWPVDNIVIGNANPAYSIIPTVDDLFTLGSPTFSWANVYVGPNHGAVLDTVSGNFGYYARTAAEISAAVTPINFSYAPGIIDRYGVNTTPGTTLMNAAFAASLAQQQAGGAPMQLLPATYMVNSNALKIPGNNVKPVVIFGVPFRSCIINTAPANTPTIQLIDQFTFEITGIVFAGRAGFPNTAIDLNSASGGQRCGFGKIIDCVLQPNGIGIHLAGLNDLVIDSCKYWPNGAGGLPGAATNDGANALPGGIVSDTNGIAGWNPGEVNAVYIRDFQAGQCNSTTATPPGAGIIIDGSLNGSSTAPLANHASTDWMIDGYDSGSCQRAIWARHCQYHTFRNLYCTEVRIDQNSIGMVVESMFGGSVVIDGTQSLGSNDRITMISCTGSVTADSANSNTAHIGCNWFNGEADASIGKSFIRGRVTGGNNTTDLIGSFGISVGPAKATQLVGASGAGLTIQTSGATVLPLNPNGNCTGTILAKPTTPSATPDGCTVKVINASSFTITMAAAGTSFVADGTSCVIPATREMDFTYITASGLWYHT